MTLLEINMDPAGLMSIGILWGLAQEISPFANEITLLIVMFFSGSLCALSMYFHEKGNPFILTQVSMAFIIGCASPQALLAYLFLTYITHHLMGNREYYER